MANHTLVVNCLTTRVRQKGKLGRGDIDRNQLQQQCQAISTALRQLLDGTASLRHSRAGQKLVTLCRRMLDPSASVAHLHDLLQEGIRELKDVMTAHHEAGHVLAYLRLTPRHRIRLNEVRFTGRVEDADVEAGVTYTWIDEPCWPDPGNPDEVIRELACVLAGKYAEPALSAGVRIDGSEREDQLAAAGLLRMLPERERASGERRARALLDAGLLSSVSRVASYLYQRWTDGDMVIPFRDLEGFLDSTVEPSP